MGLNKALAELSEYGEEILKVHHAAALPWHYSAVKRSLAVYGGIWHISDKAEKGHQNQLAW